MNDRPIKIAFWLLLVNSIAGLLYLIFLYHALNTTIVSNNVQLALQLSLLSINTWFAYKVLKGQLKIMAYSPWLYFLQTIKVQTSSIDIGVNMGVNISFALQFSGTTILLNLFPLLIGLYLLVTWHKIKANEPVSL